MKQNTQYLDEIESAMNGSETSAFVYNIKDRVYHQSFGLNCMVVRRMRIDDRSGTFKAYDVAMKGKDARVYTEVEEGWLLKGHMRSGE